MKILYIVGGLPYGGVETMLLNIMKEAKKQGTIDMTAVNISGLGVMMEDFEKAGLRVISLFNSKKPLKTYKIGTMLKLRNLIKSEAPDAVHTSHFSADYFTRLACLGLNIPVITHIHNTRPERKAFRGFMNRLLSRRTDLFISISKMVYEHVEQSQNVARKKNILVYNTFDPHRDVDPVTDLKEICGEDSINILVIGRMINKLKRIDLAIDAFAIAKEKVPNANLVIIGDGGDLDMLKAHAENSGCSDSIHFLGYRKDIPHILKQGHMFFMPSASEGLPITHLEAMYFGLPAVISENVPSKELEPCSSLICSMEAEDVADKVVNILTDKELYDRLSANAKEVASIHSVDGYVKGLYKIYSELIQNKS